MVNYKKIEKDGFEIFQVNGDFVMGQIGDLLDDYTNLIRDGKYKFIFDLSNVDLIDSSGLGTILMGATHIMQHNEKIRICFDTDNATVKELFRVVRLDAIIDYYPSVDDAVKGENKIDEIF